jgi:hypothetical protein
MHTTGPNDLMTRRRLLARMASLGLSLASLPLFAQTDKKPPKARLWNEKYELAVDFEINQPDAWRYARPYVAVWVDNREGKSVRTLCLWVRTTGRGPRWIPDLRRWYRNEQERRRGGTDLVATVSSATRMPGKYALVWDGKDDTGKPVEQGDYSIYLEAAREHGTYQLLRKDVTIGGKAFKHELEGNVEIRKATLEYRKRR